MLADTLHVATLNRVAAKVKRTGMRVTVAAGALKVFEGIDT
jgi:hypothetical protein